MNGESDACLTSGTGAVPDCTSRDDWKGGTTGVESMRWWGEQHKFNLHSNHLPFGMMIPIFGSLLVLSPPVVVVVVLIRVPSSKFWRTNTRLCDDGASWWWWAHVDNPGTFRLLLAPLMMFGSPLIGFFPACLIRSTVCSVQRHPSWSSHATNTEALFQSRIMILNHHHFSSSSAAAELLDPESWIPSTPPARLPWWGGSTLEQKRILFSRYSIFP